MMQLDDRLEPGVRVGDYEVVSRIVPGQFLARHVADHHRVRLSVLLDDDAVLVSVQLFRATSTIARLNHPGIARIITHGMLAGARPCLPRPRWTPMLGGLEDGRPTTVAPVAPIARKPQ